MSKRVPLYVSELELRIFKEALELMRAKHGKLSPISANLLSRTEETIDTFEGDENDRTES